MADVAPTDEELRAFLGPNAGYYLYKWNPVRRGAARRPGFNAAGFWLAPFWLAYRKLYTPMLLVLIGMTMESVLEKTVLLSIGPQEAWTVYLRYVWGAIVGFRGNTWYWRYTERQVRRARALTSAEGERIRYLERKGGRSIVMAVVAPLLGLVCLGLVARMLGAPQ